MTTHRDPVYRMVITVEVLSDDFDAIFGLDDLGSVAYYIGDGPGIGCVTHGPVEVVPADKVDEHLIRLGNDGTWFDEIQ